MKKPMSIEESKDTRKLLGGVSSFLTVKII